MKNKSYGDFMNITELKEIALAFRNALEEARYDGKFKNPCLIDFPRGSCGETSDLIAEYLLKNKKIHCKIISAKISGDSFDKMFSHAWIEINDNIIIDITADQYKYENYFNEVKEWTIPCYVGRKTALHNMFEIIPNGISEFQGIEFYGNPARMNLINEYSIVMDYLKLD